MFIIKTILEDEIRYHAQLFDRVDLVDGLVSTSNPTALIF